MCYELNIDTYYIFEFENVLDEDLSIPEIAVPVLHIGYFFDDEIEPTGAAPQYTKWNATIKLMKDESYYVSADDIYSVIMFNKDDLDSDDTFFDSSVAEQVIFKAPYTGYYYIVIEKKEAVAMPSYFCVAPIQEMTEPFNSESVYNSYTYSAKEARLFSFELSADCTISFNGAFGETDTMFLKSSDLSEDYATTWKNGFQQVELTKGIYYIAGSNMQDVDDVLINYYLVCGHNFGEDNICDVCDYTCGHSSSNINNYGVCEICGYFFGSTLKANRGSISPQINDDSSYAYYRISLSAGKYVIYEEKGEGCAGYDYSIYKEGTTNAPFSDDKEFTITDAGTYYIVVYDEYDDFDEGGNSFHFLEDATDFLFSDDEPFKEDGEIGTYYYYYVNITTAGIYGIETTMGTISLLGQTTIRDDGKKYYDLTKGGYIVKLIRNSDDEEDSMMMWTYGPVRELTVNTLDVNITIGENDTICYKVSLTDGDYSIQTGSTLDIGYINKEDATEIDVDEDGNFSIEETGDYYIFVYNVGADTTTGAFGLQ